MTATAATFVTTGGYQACSGCGTPGRSDARFCTTCGRPRDGARNGGWRLELIGAHGGAGTSTLAAMSGLAESVTARPQASSTTSYVAVARTSASGLTAARHLLREAILDSHADVLGLVLVPDAPGRLPKPLRELVDLTTGAAPRVWSARWVEDLRFATQPPCTPPAPLRDLVAALTQLRPRHQARS